MSKPVTKVNMKQVVFAANLPLDFKCKIGLRRDSKTAKTKNIGLSFIRKPVPILEAETGAPIKIYSGKEKGIDNLLNNRSKSILRLKETSKKKQAIKHGVRIKRNMPVENRIDKTVYENNLNKSVLHDGPSRMVQTKKQTEANSKRATKQASKKELNLGKKIQAKQNFAPELCSSYVFCPHPKIEKSPSRRYDVSNSIFSFRNKLRASDATIPRVKSATPNHRSVKKMEYKPPCLIFQSPEFASLNLNSVRANTPSLKANLHVTKFKEKGTLENANPLYKYVKLQQNKDPKHNVSMEAHSRNKDIYSTTTHEKNNHILSKKWCEVSALFDDYLKKKINATYVANAKGDAEKNYIDDSNANPPYISLHQPPEPNPKKEKIGGEKITRKGKYLKMADYGGKEKEILRWKKHFEESTDNGSTTTNKSSLLVGKSKYNLEAEDSPSSDGSGTVIENDCDNDYSLLFESLQAKY